MIRLNCCFIRINRAFLFVFFILIQLAISQFMIVCEASTTRIYFNEFPEGTIITNQYQNLGVIFSGEPENQKINTPYDIFDSTEGPALLSSYTVDSYGYPNGTGTLTINFVIPGTNIPAAASSYGFNSYYYAFYTEDHIFTFYPSDGEPIVKTWWDLYSFGDWPTVPITKIVMTPAPGVRSTLLWIDSFHFQIVCSGTDADGDGHYTPSSCLSPNDDCDDTNPSIPGPEVCGDGKDNDCDGKPDCADSECLTDTLCFPRGCTDISE